MKTNTTKNSRQQASTLALTLITTAILGFVLVAYLSLVRSQNVSNMRSQTWNQAMPVIEAGIEDALTQLNTHGKTNLACDSWTWDEDHNLYWIKRHVGTSSNYYVVAISNWFLGMSNGAPAVESRGYVSMPVIRSSDPCYTTNSDFFKTAEYTPAASTSWIHEYLGRAVLIHTKRDFLFTKGMVAKGYIDLKGNKIASDSFNSLYGKYNTFTSKGLNRFDHGDIATNAGLTNSLSVGQADIWGRVATGPNGSVSIGGGSVGDMQWHLDGKRGIEPGFDTDDMNVDFEDVNPPDFSAGYWGPAPGTNNGVYYDYLLGAEANYQMDTLTLSGNQILLVTNNATLYVTGDISISGSASIIIASNASLNLYCNGAKVDLGGNGVVNQAGNATNFTYWGTTNNTSLSLSGGSGFVGTIYAPEANFTLNGGGGNINTDFYGASVTASVKINGNFNFHYDEALAQIGPWRRYIVTKWDEMTPQQMASGPLDYSPWNIVP